MVASIGIDHARRDFPTDPPSPTPGLLPTNIDIEDVKDLPPKGPLVDASLVDHEAPPTIDVPTTEVQETPVFEYGTKEEASAMALEVIGKKLGHKLGPQEIEIINAMCDVGDTDGFIANILGRGKSTISAYRKKQETSLTFDDADNEERTKQRNKFIGKAYDLSFLLLEELSLPARIAGAKFEKIAITLGIVIDKVLLASARFETSTEEGGMIKTVKGMDDGTLRKFISSSEKILGLSAGRQASEDNSREHPTDTDGPSS